MTLPADRLILLDTSILVHLMRLDVTGRRITAEYEPMTRAERPLISTVNEGEILGLARCWKWGSTKLRKLERLLVELVRVEAGQRRIVESYAEVYFQSRASGNPCGENDLWIAATARATGAILLTCDRDFDWMHPALIERILVSS